MYNLLSGEFYKLKREKTFKIITLVCFCMAILLAIASAMEGFLSANDSEIIQLFTGLDALRESINNPGFMLFLGGVFAGLFIGKDFSNKTINHAISMGHSRLSIFISKLIVFLFATTAFMLTYVVMRVTIAIFISGWGEAFTSTSLLYAIRILIMGIIVNFTISSLCFMFAFIIRDSAKTITFSFGLVIVNALLGSIYLMWGEKIYIMTQIYKYSIFSQPINIIKEAFTVTDLNILIMSIIGTMILTYTFAYSQFRRCDLN